MELILLERIHNLGNLGDQVSVKPGYGRNFLIPQGKAVPATKSNVAKFEGMRHELEKKAADALTAAQARATEIEALNLIIKANAGTEGKLYGSVGAHEIADAAQAAGVTVEKKEVRLPEGPIRTIGEFEVDIHLHTDVNVVLKLVVEAEETIEE